MGDGLVLQTKESTPRRTIIYLRHITTHGDWEIGHGILLF